MRTVAETAVFIRYAAEAWDDATRMKFVSWIANNPLAGRVIPNSGGCRKVRWSRKGQGKRGGARVIYFCAADQVIWLLIVHSKSGLDTCQRRFSQAAKRN
jgi:hypothetical protein